MIKRDSVIACRDMWQWLADNPGCEKNDYFRVHDLREPHNLCYCCEDVWDGNQTDCAACFLLSLWPDGCMDPNSIYIDWWRSPHLSAERRESALRIVAACDKLLKGDIK